MNKTCLILLLFVHFSGFAQTKAKDSIPVREVIGNRSNYKDFVISGKQLYGLTKGDSLIIWNIRKEKVEKVVSGVSSIAKGKSGKTLCSKSSGEIVEVSNKKQWKRVAHFSPDATVYNLVVDNEGYPALLTNKGVLYKNSLYVPPLDTPFYRKAGRLGGKGDVIKPDVVFLDREQRLWMGYDAGEWGGDGCFFDLRTKEFYFDEGLETKYINKYDPDFEKNLNPSFSDLLKEFPEDIKITATDTLYRFPNGFTLAHSKGITQDDKGNFYISHSLMHFFVDGCMIFVKGRDGVFYKTTENKRILKHSMIDGFVEGTKMIDIEEYLGPVSFNPYDKSVYYFTNEGFYRLIETDGNYSKEFIFQPRIIWTPGLPDAVGYQMSVTKFEFTAKSKFFFITGKNGIGYYDGREVVYFR